MIYFNNDYSEGCIPEIMDKLTETNLDQTSGYGVDTYCMDAADKIRKLCKRDDLFVHFLVGGTQTNLTVIASALRPYQGVIAPTTGHISVHETGAIEATGHKVLELPNFDGKITAEQIDRCATSQSNSMDAEHTVQPKMVYISSPTELGTLYTKQELADIRKACEKHDLYLFLDGARMGYGLAAEDNDAFLPDYANYCDVFYIGGTKVGALFGEAVVISNPALAKDFRYMIKQRGGMLAKGRLLGLQFGVLLEEDRYFKIAQYANRLADQIRTTISTLGYGFLVENKTNQIFPILPDKLLDKLSENFCFSEMERFDDQNRVVRFCTSWATTEENVNALCDAIRSLSV